MKVYVEGVGILAPGLADWAAARDILRGERPYLSAPMPKPVADLLPPTERRRCGEVVRLALHVGMAALQGSRTRAQTLPTVFTSASGNGEVIQQICEVLATAEREVSPTRFHNSVHNAAAGYWGIATGSHAPSTSLCAADGSFAAGLVEAALQAGDANDAVLLIAYDLPHPEPMAARCPVIASFGAALVLSNALTVASLAALEMTFTQDEAETRSIKGPLESLRSGNSAARSLPLLQALALATRARLTLPYVSGCQLAVALTPCN